MSNVTLNDAFNFYSKQSDSSHRAWGYFQAISILTLGYTIENKAASQYLLILLGYLTFLVASLWVVHQSQKELHHFNELVCAVSKQDPLAKDFIKLRTVSPVFVTLFQLLYAGVVVAAIVVTGNAKCGSLTNCQVKETSQSTSPSK